MSELFTFKIQDSRFMLKVKFKEILSYMGYEEGEYTNSFGNIKIGSLRKAFFKILDEELTGYIIGDRVYYEGLYDEGCKPTSYLDSDSYEPVTLTNRKAVRVYKVVTDYNKIYEVQKDYLEIQNPFIIVSRRIDKYIGEN